MTVDDAVDVPIIKFRHVDETIVDEDCSSSILLY
jgi:hypothetical protein